MVCRKIKNYTNNDIVIPDTRQEGHLKQLKKKGNIKLIGIEKYKTKKNDGLMVVELESVAFENFPYNTTNKSRHPDIIIDLQQLKIIPSYFAGAVYTTIPNMLFLNSALDKKRNPNSNITEELLMLRPRTKKFVHSKTYKERRIKRLLADKEFPSCVKTRSASKSPKTSKVNTKQKLQKCIRLLKKKKLQKQKPKSDTESSKPVEQCTESSTESTVFDENTTDSKSQVSNGDYIGSPSKIVPLEKSNSIRLKVVEKNEIAKQQLLRNIICHETIEDIDKVIDDDITYISEEEETNDDDDNESEEDNSEDEEDSASDNEIQCNILVMANQREAEFASTIFGNNLKN